MTNPPQRFGQTLLTFAAALGTTLVAGSFLTFSVMVMPGMRNLDAATGTAAMQAVNEPAFGLPFQLLFSGTSVLCVAAGLAALIRWNGRASALVLTGAVLSLLAGVVVTGAVHIPLTYELAELDPAQATDTQWRDFLSAWIPWNHVRSALGLVAAVVTFAGLRYHFARPAERNGAASIGRDRSRA